MKELDITKLRHGTDLVKKGFAKMQKGGVIMDVTTVEQARIAEKSGAVAVMALERVPADIRASGGVARMADPTMIKEIINTVSIPVMAKARIGHFVEAQALEALGVDMIDESEVPTPADPFYHIDKRLFTIPFVCGCRNLGEATRRIWEGAAMIRTKGEAGTGNIIEAIRHQRMVTSMITTLKTMDKTGLQKIAEEYCQSYITSYKTLTNQEANEKTCVFGDTTYDVLKKEVFEILKEIKELQRLPVVNFAAGGIATPADAAIMMQLGNDGVFVGSGIFKSKNPEKRAKAIVEAVAHYDDPAVIAEVSKNLGEAMLGIEISTIPKEQLLQERGSAIVTIGVLSIQGAVSEHVASMNQALKEAQQPERTIFVRQQKDIGSIDGLILPGGESTTISRFLTTTGMYDAIRLRMEKNDLPIMGTCAGCALLAKELTDTKADVRLLEAMDMQVELKRIWPAEGIYERIVDFKGFSTPYHGVFIRAPVITKIWGTCEVLATVEKEIVAARQDNYLALSFHPELTNDLRMHRFFLEML